MGTNSSSKATTSSSEDGAKNGASSAAGGDGDKRNANQPEYKPGSGYYDTYDPTGEYIIEQALGRGGHGSVHLARHRTQKYAHCTKNNTECKKHVCRSRSNIKAKAPKCAENI